MDELTLLLTTLGDIEFGRRKALMRVAELEAFLNDAEALEQYLIELRNNQAEQGYSDEPSHPQSPEPQETAEFGEVPLPSLLAE